MLPRIILTMTMLTACSNAEEYSQRPVRQTAPLPPPIAEASPVHTPTETPNFEPRLPEKLAEVVPSPTPEPSPNIFSFKLVNSERRVSAGSTIYVRPMTPPENYRWDIELDDLNDQISVVKQGIGDFKKRE